MITETTRKIDLIHLVEHHVNRRGKRAGVKWTRFPCPFCKTFPESLFVTNGDGERGNWFYCKICDRRGGALEWIMMFQRKSKIEALMYLQPGRNIHIRIAEIHKPTANTEGEADSLKVI